MGMSAFDHVARGRLFRFERARHSLCVGGTLEPSFRVFRGRRFVGRLRRIKTSHPWPDEVVLELS